MTFGRGNPDSMYALQYDMHVYIYMYIYCIGNIHIHVNFHCGIMGTAALAHEETRRCASEDAIQKFIELKADVNLVKGLMPDATLMKQIGIFSTKRLVVGCGFCKFGDPLNL